MDLQTKFQSLVNKLNIGQIDEVIFEASHLNKKHPDQEAFYNLLAIAYQLKGQAEKSIELLENALKRSKNNHNFLNNLGLSYFKIKNYLKAEEFFLKVLEIKPKYINAINNLASLYEEINQFEKAKKLLEESLKINSDVLETNYNYASLLQTQGSFIDAKKYYRKTLELNNNFTKADRALAMLEKYKIDNNHIKEMENKIENKNLHKDNIKDLSFGLGKIYEDIGDYEKSFFYINKANKLKKELTGYNFKNDKDLFDKIVQLYNKINSNNIPQSKVEKKVIFILGMPRTGTSLVEQIISSHSKVFGAGEILLLSNFFQSFFKKNNKSEDLEKKIYEYKNNYLRILSKMTDLEIITDKAPLNFRWIGFIKLMLPNSKIIHCTRDPFENSWSIFKNEFEGGMFFSNNLGDIANYFKLYEKLMLFWKEKFKDEIFEIKYEDLINSSEEKIKKLVNFCNLDWEKECLQFYKNKKSIKTVSFAQARKPIYKNSVNATLNFKKFLKDLENNLKN